MSNNQPAEPDGATGSARKSRRQQQLFWGARVLDALLPNGFAPKLKSSGRSGSNDWVKFVPLAAAAGVVLFVIFLQLSLQKPTVACAFKIPKQVEGAVSARATECVSLEVAKTQSALVRGLSGRREMSRDRGLLFDFPEVSKKCMWMKDMHFRLDMIWLDASKKIVYMHKDIGPETYPKLTFCSPMPAKYVVEVNSGIVDAAGLQVGQRLDF